MYATASTHGLLRLVAVLSTRHPVVTIALLGLPAEAVDRRQGIGIGACLCGVVATSGRVILERRGER